MPDLEVTANLVGCKVCCPARPEWGIGTVLRVQPTTVGGRRVQRVSVQFVSGHRQLVVPPARLAEPRAEPQRDAGWLDKLGGTTVDDRLVSLPESVRESLGTPAQRIAALAPLYEYTEDSASLGEWARRQAQVADPLALWSRDELLVAFRRFCTERDTHFRVFAALLKQQEGPAALTAVVDAFPAPVRAAMNVALQRVV